MKTKYLLITLAFICLGFPQTAKAIDDPRYSPPVSAPAKTTEDLCLKKWASDLEAQRRYCSNPPDTDFEQEQQIEDRRRLRNLIDSRS